MDNLIYFDGSFKQVEWDPLKDQRLRQTRGKGFGDVLSMNRWRELGHPTRSNQILILFEERGRVWAVPCVVSQDRIFFKTLYASRKYTSLFLKGGCS